MFEHLDRTLLDEIRSHSLGIDQLEAKKIVYQMLKACSHMHSNGIIHRDIKPENMLLSRNGILKVCDLGFACLMQRKNFSEYVSTRWYRAPELLVYHHYGPEIDVWAVGCIFVELMTGNPLFPGKNDMDMMRLILQMFNGSEELPSALKQTF